jgi:ABC-type polysaccharide/polyol phosphate transport system ATPase subunit
MEENIIEFENVSMCYHITKERIDNMKEYFIKMLKRKLHYEELYGVKNVSFTIKKGEAIGIIGPNGSGKSTVLKIIAGIIKNTSGEVTVRGSIAPIIELGAGFDYDLTARENIILNGVVLGHSKKNMLERFNEIMDFSELWEFVDVPLKNYSSGMVARLAFAIATLVQPDILIVDEILAVGDSEFQKKCEKKMAEIMENGTTLVLVSHTMSQVKEICSRAIWLNKGEVVMAGPATEVCNAYLATI